MKKNILVTGAAGFIGSHLCERLLREGYTVTGLDSFNDFYDPAMKRRNLEMIFRTARAMASDAGGGSISDGATIESEVQGAFRIVEGDLRDAALLADLFGGQRIDAVIHLAAYAGVRPSIEQTLLYMDVNVKGTVTLLEQMRQSGVRQFIFASSSSVYGHHQRVPFSELDPVDYAVSPYAASKKAGEVISYTYHHLYGIQTACLRFFTVYGPRQRPDLAIHKFARYILAGLPVPVYGDGSTSRDYTYIDDVIEGIIRALAWTGVGQPRYGIFNLGGSIPVSLSEMINTLSGVLGVQPHLIVHPEQPGDVPRTFADLTLSRRELGYQPQTMLREGLQQFAAWLIAESADSANENNEKKDSRMEGCPRENDM